ncbi:tight adherence protein C [Lipingzhangella halophila]|uniref:Tight adherence protein C n=1 Tax=Lipingzhangella halophila TaxID=1783352 RepID=A0A7W7RDZ5_9ACTN|nr:type II secretion system F family protein [Lipingzhangella halophila]MBB4930144.1 tight adherence protein C [Lipingzhangella halophila]
MSLSFPILLLLALAGAMCVGLLAWGFLLMRSETNVAVDMTDSPKAITKDDDETFILHRITEGIGRPFLPTVQAYVDEQRVQNIQRRINLAGQPDNLTVERYLSRKAGEVLLYGILALFCLFSDQIMFALLALGFIALTDISLHTEANKRQDEIQRQLPDFLDVLAVTVGSGLSFRQALSRVADSMPGVLASEFRIALRQMDLGTSRREAFQALRSRNNNESLGRFVTALQQAEELGSPLADTLMTIGQDMRREDAQYLRRKAQKLNPKITGITAATMLPGLLLLVGGGLLLGGTIDLGGVFSGE